MGIEEKKLLDWYKNDQERYNTFMTQKLFWKTDSDGITRCYIKNDKSIFSAGYFQEFSLKELRAATNAFTVARKGSFSVIEGKNTKSSSWFRKFVDIGALQANPENNDAVFQVASNFSALEPISATDLPENGVTKYIYDLTQGPFASISAAPGLLLRMYGIFYSPSSQPALWKQTANKQINLLDEVADYYPVINGYVQFTEDSLFELFPSKRYSDIKIGWHGDIQVTQGFLINNQLAEKVANPKQLINQVFTAGVDFGDLNKQYRKNAQANKRAYLVLKAAYEGTLRAAIVKGKKKVFLTLIGGGVFQNEFDAIIAAIDSYRHLIMSSGLDVIVVLYNTSDFMEPNARLLKLTRDAKGSYTVYSEFGKTVL